MIAIEGAQVMTGGGWELTDVLIEDGIVAALGEGTGGARLVIDGTGLFVGPGFVDIHAHLRDPGQTWKEDMSSGTAAAARGGFVAIVAMPNTDPAVDSGEMVRRCRKRAADVAEVDVAFAGSLTLGRGGEEMAHLDDMYDEGVRLFTDDGDAVADAGLLRRILTYTSDRPDIVIAQHAEDPAISAGGHINDGAASQTLGIVGVPASAETSVIARDLELVAETGGRYHVQHLSTARGVELVRRAKQEGLRVTAEVTPHHLRFTEEDAMSLDPSFKMYPPLRTGEDRAALISALIDGTIDVVATDHAPHGAMEKDVPFEDAPRGVTGLETAFPVTLDALEGDIGALFDRMSVAPARIAGLASHGLPVQVGAPANLTLVDPSRRWVVEAFRSRSANSPFLGRELEGSVVATIVGGEVIYGVGS